MDYELKQAFVELQRKMVATNQKIQMKDQQIEHMNRIKKENDITSQEFSKLSPDTVVYESVGRSFILTELSEMKENLNAENKSIDEKVGKLAKDKDVLSRSIKLSEENLRELVLQKKNQS